MIAPRWYQTEADEALWAALFPHTGRNPVTVLPTGAGKSVSIAMFGKRVIENDGRLIVLQHRAELVNQNAEKMAAIVGAANVGVYSAGLKARDIDAPIILASIQSVYDKAHLFGRRHAVGIDEAHLVPHEGEGMYRTFLDSLGNYSPNLRITGWTATPFRTDSGPLCSPDGIFHKISYSAPVPRLVGEGFLSPITNQPTETRYDTSRLHVRGGEFVAREVENLFSDDERKVVDACREIVARCHDRRSVLVFCAGVRHADMVRSHLERIAGEPCGLVTGQTMPLERAAALADFKARRLRWLVGVDVLTTGFDAPCVDAIAVLRATESAGLFAQICGRGFRIFPGKVNCLLLDFGQNLERHGPLDSPDYGRRKGGHGATTGEAPAKSCPNCGNQTATAARECLNCGFRFPDPEIARHGTTADMSSAVVGFKPPEPVKWLVRSWSAARHQKKWRRCDAGCALLDPGEECEDCGTRRPYDTLRIDYACEPADREGNLTGEKISEWVCIEHPGFVQQRAFQWWGGHSNAPPPANIAEALELFTLGALAMPTELTTVEEGYFKRITGRVIPPPPTAWASPDADDPFREASTVDEWSVPQLAGGDDDVPF